MPQLSAFTVTLFSDGCELRVYYDNPDRINHVCHVDRAAKQASPLDRDDEP